MMTCPRCRYRFIILQNDIRRGSRKGHYYVVCPRCSNACTIKKIEMEIRTKRQQVLSYYS